MIDESEIHSSGLSAAPATLPASLASRVNALGPVFVSYRQSDGTELAEDLAWALRAAGVPVELQVWPGVIHDFINMGRFLPEAAQAHTALAEALKQAFSA